MNFDYKSYFNETYSSMSQYYDYIFSTLPVDYINIRFYEAFQIFLISLLQTSLSLLHIIFYISLYIIKILILVFPHAVSLCKVIYNFHRTQLTLRDIIIEIIMLTIIFVYLLFRKRIMKSWEMLINELSAKSKIAAIAAPHILYFTVSIIIILFGNKFILPFTSSKMMPVFTLIIPLVRTIRMNTIDLNELTINQMKDMMLIWIIIAIYHSIVTALSFIPFSQRILLILPLVKELIISILLWVQLSPSFSKILFDSIIYKILFSVSNMIPAGYRISNTNPTTASTNAVLAMFKMMNILNDSQITFLHALFQDSVATIVAIVFIFTPTFIANYGMITIALLLPAIRTASCCAPSTEKDSSKHNNYITTTTTTAAAFPLQWLHYWMCVSILWILRIYAFKFWPSCLILMSLWLQHSYFLGATFVFNYTYQTILICIHRNEKVQQEKSKQNLLLLKENIDSIDVAVAIADDDNDDNDWNKNDGVDMDKDTQIEGQNIDCCSG
jgi:hypothetical protein